MGSPDAAAVASILTGHFSSAAQAADSPDDYLEIHLFTAPIWTDRTDAHWLYVEQAAAGALNRPYRQRVYRVVAEDGGVRSDVFELPGDPLAFAGAYATPERLDELGPGDLAPRSGCSIFLVREGEAFVGATRGSGCESSLRGASYATSEVHLEAAQLRTWDRGFDGAGEQVWGATEGPYLFDRHRP